MLYIGSEKPSNIEGLPRLTGQRAGADTLEFYKPNWFPNTFKIEAYVKEGKQLFETYINEFYDGDKEGCLSGKNFEALMPFLKDCLCGNGKVQRRLLKE